MREADEAINPPPDQPVPSQAAADMMMRGEWPPTPTRAPLRAHFDQQLRRGKWIGFGFSEEEGRRVPIRSPWRKELTYDDNGAIANGNRRTHVEVLFYGVGARKPVPPASTIEQAGADKGNTSAGRLRAKKWLANHIEEGEHTDRDTTLQKMRVENKGLGVRGGKSVFRDFSREHPELELSRPGRKSKRNANN
jgi:hypothetical protein